MNIKNGVGLFFTGLGIGIFLGLSESSILLQILIPFLTIIVGLLSILTGQKNDDKSNTNDSSLLTNKNISPFPIMWVVLGMVAGSFLGLLAKNYDITGRGEIFGQTTYSKELSSTKLVDAESRKADESRKSSTVLHGISEDLCEQKNLCNLKGVELLCTLNEMENPEIEEMLSKKVLNLDSIKIKINLSCKCQK